MICRLFSNVWLKPPLNGSEFAWDCHERIALYLVRRIVVCATMFHEWEFLWFLVVYTRERPEAFSAVNCRLLKGPQELGEVLLVFKVRFKNCE